MAQAALVGRQRELELVGRALADGRSVVVSGPIGCGRSAFLRAAAALAADASADVATIVGTAPMASLPLGALAARFADRLPPRVAENIATPEGVAAIITSLLSVDGKRTVIVVDDAHHLDGLSAAVLLDLVASQRADVVVGIRSDLAAPEPVSALWKNDHAELVNIDNLADDDIEDLVNSMLGGPIDPRSLRTLVTTTGGRLPLLTAAVESAIRADRVTQSAGLWKITPGPVGDEILGLCASSLDGLDDDALAVVDVLSVAGSAHVTALLASTAERTLDDLERAGILVVDEHRDRSLIARLQVPLLAEARREVSGTLARRRRLAKAAAAIDATAGATTDDRLTAALLHLELGDSLDATTALGAAQTARARSRPKQAAALASAALDAGAGAQAVLLLASIDAAAGRPRDADGRLRQLYLDTSAEPESAGKGVTLAATAIARADNFLFGLFQPTDALRVIEASEGGVTDPDWIAQFAVRRGVLSFVGGDVTGAGRTVEPYLARTSGNALVAGCFLAAFSCTMSGRLNEALELLDRAAATPEGDGAGDLPSWDRPSIEVARCLALEMLGRSADADAVAKRGHRVAIDGHDATRQALFAWCRAGVALAIGRPKTCLRRTTEAASLMAAGGQTTPLRLVLHDVARAQALLGRIDEARATLAEADRIGESTTGDLGAESGRLRAHAWVEAADGALGLARQLLTECAENAMIRGEVINELMARHDLVRFGGTAEADRVDELVGQCDGDLAGAIARHARGVIEGRACLLADAADTFERLGRPLLASEAAAALAEVLAADGDPREAAKMAVRSGALSARCEGASTPTLTRSNVVSVLSPRETEVARLAARGLSNKEVAARLFVSARTVESQLQRAYTKLGIRRRDELAAALELVAET